MVKKLIKHEFIYYFRSYGMFMPIILAIGIMTKVFSLFGDKTIIGNIISFFSFFLLMLGSIALILLSTVAIVVRFYKNLYSSEGYLTFTLPVSNFDHIFVKLLAALAWQAICYLTVFAAMFLPSIGQDFGALFDEFSTLFTFLFSKCGVVNVIFYIIEAIILFFLSAASGILLFYACISLGQRARKNRVLMAVVAYFVYYSITQVVTTILMIFLAVLLVATGLINRIEEWVTLHYVPAIHIGLIILIAISVAMTTLFWFISQNTMDKKLNLE